MFNNSFFFALEELGNAINILQILQILLNVFRHAGSTIVKLQIILFLFEYIIYIHFVDLPKCCFVQETFPQCLVSIKHQVGMWG